MRGRVGSLLLFICCWALLVGPAARALEVNDDGRALMTQAGQAYGEDMRQAPLFTDAGLQAYVESVLKRLAGGQKPPAGLRLHLTLLDSPTPEIYSYADGHLVLTSGALFATANEAQLAALLSHEVAHLLEGHYLELYQEIKAAERHQRRKAMAGALFGALLDTAVDYVVEVESAKQYEQAWQGEDTYLNTVKSVARINAAQGAYYSIKDVINNMPAKDNQGSWIDPRQRFEVVADAQGMACLARAGYDVGEASRAWENVVAGRSAQARDKERAMGPWAAQLRQTESMMNMMQGRMRQQLGASGLVQTIGEPPPSRPQLLTEFVNLDEVRQAKPKARLGKGEASFRQALEKSLVPRAERAIDEGNYPAAADYYRVLHESGVRSGAVSYGLAKSSLGDFAFSASEAEKQRAEGLYLEAARLDKKYALPYRGLGELYEEWDRYLEAAAAYNNYLKRAPRARDREKIERKIKTLKRKASR